MVLRGAGARKARRVALATDGSSPRHGGPASDASVVETPHIRSLRLLLTRDRYDSDHGFSRPPRSGCRRFDQRWRRREGNRVAKSIKDVARVQGRSRAARRPGDNAWDNHDPDTFVRLLADRRGRRGDRVHRYQYRTDAHGRQRDPPDERDRDRARNLHRPGPRRRDRRVQQLSRRGRNDDATGLR